MRAAGQDHDTRTEPTTERRRSGDRRAKRGSYLWGVRGRSRLVDRGLPAGIQPPRPDGATRDRPSGGWADRPLTRADPVRPIGHVSIVIIVGNGPRRAGHGLSLGRRDGKRERSRDEGWRQIRSIGVEVRRDDGETCRIRAAAAGLGWRPRMLKAARRARRVTSVSSSAPNTRRDSARTSSGASSRTSRNPFSSSTRARKRVGSWRRTAAARSSQLTSADLTAASTQSRPPLPIHSGTRCRGGDADSRRPVVHREPGVGS